MMMVDALTPLGCACAPPITAQAANVIRVLAAAFNPSPPKA
jgi:hypothetical protein